MKKVLMFALVAVLAISSLALAAPKTAPVRASDDGSASTATLAITKPNVSKVAGTDTLGVTNFDWMHNGPMGAQVVADQIGGLHFGWTYRNLAGTSGSRFPAYNHWDASNGWLGETNASTNGVGRWGTVGCKPTGEGLFAFYFTSGAVYPNIIAVDAIPGVGLFDNYAIDTIPTPDAYAHPYLAVVSPETMFVVSDGDLDEPMFNYSFDGGVTWGTWADLSNGEAFGFPNYNIAAQHNKVAICHLDTFSNVIYKESFDYGNTWNSWRVAIAAGAETPAGDTIVPYISGPVCFYDADGKLIVAVNYYQYTGDITVAYDNGIAVWDSVNGLVVAATQSITPDAAYPAGWDQIGGSNVLACAWPWIVQAATGELVISYTQFDIADTSANGYGNGELYAVKSSIGGATWGPKTNISNSPTPLAADGEAEDDRYPGCTILGDSVHFAWLCSKVAGSALQDGTTATMDPMLHYAVAVSALGVEGTTDARTPVTRFALNQSNPNPARSIASISFNLPKSGNYSLKIYNIAGQVIRTLDGQGAAGQNTVTWNGMDNNGRKVANGVYLYNLNAFGNSATKKLVVVR